MESDREEVETKTLYGCWFNPVRDEVPQEYNLEISLHIPCPEVNGIYRWVFV